MDSGMVSKIEKARLYSQEKDRVKFVRFTVMFRGGHDTHTVEYEDGKWRCGCRFFAQRGVCSHTMAMERILEGMLADES